MSLTIEAIYEDGVLKPDRPLPFQEHERLTVSVGTLAAAGRKGKTPKKSPISRIRETAGLVEWTGGPQALEYLLGPENGTWEPS